MIVAGDMNVGALVAASILSARALAPMRQIALAWSQFQQAREAVARLDELMAERAEASGRLAGAEIVVHGRLRVERVVFRYPGASAAGAGWRVLRGVARHDAGRGRAAGLGQEHAGASAARH